MYGVGFRWPLTALEREPAFMAPRVNVAETGKEVEVTAELPGLEEKDIHVTLDENLLTIRGEKSAEHEKQKKNYHLMERSVGSFLRTIPLPPGVDPPRVKASFKQGVLKVALPKRPEAQAQRKQIKVETE